MIDRGIDLSYTLCKLVGECPYLIFDWSDGIFSSPVNIVRINTYVERRRLGGGGREDIRVGFCEVAFVKVIAVPFQPLFLALPNAHI